MEAHVNGIKLHYVDQGSGPVLLFIHAFPLTSAMWQAQIDAFAARFRVIAPDLRGFGQSEVTSGPSLMHVFADDLAALLDHIGAERATLIGISMGGYITMAFLRYHAARARAVVLADTRSAPDNEQGKAARERNARMVEEQGLRPLADDMVPNLVSPGAASHIKTGLHQLIEHNNPAGVAAALRGMAERPDSKDLLSTITMPTLLLVGEHDVLTPPEEMQLMHNIIPNSQIAQIPAAGHISCMEQPEAFTAALDTFLSGLR